MFGRSKLSRSQRAEVTLLVLCLTLPMYANLGLAGLLVVGIVMSLCVFRTMRPDKDDFLLSEGQNRRLASNCSTCAHPAVTVCKVCGTPFCPDHGRATSMVCANHVARAGADSRRQWLWGIVALVLVIAGMEICVRLLSTIP
jgi:hypothetical protein